MSQIRYIVYLLSKMRSQSHVAAALAALGVRPSEVPDLIQPIVSVETKPQTAEQFDDWLGSPSTIRLATRDEAPRSFEGSTRYGYSLSLWPDLEFAVYLDRNGVAWGQGFVQAHRRALPAELETIEPWRWAKDCLVAAAHGYEVIDQWSFDCDLQLRFEVQGGGIRVFRGEFDFDVLQSWRSQD